MAEPMTVQNAEITGPVTLVVEVDVDGEILRELTSAIAIGIALAFRNHAKRVDQGIRSMVEQEATSYAIQHLMTKVRAMHDVDPADPWPDDEDPPEAYSE